MGVSIKVRPANEPLRIYKFGPVNEGSAAMKDVLGGKGANLAEMVIQGLPVPPGFTIPTRASTRYQAVKGLPARLDEFMDDMWAKVADGLEYLTKEFGYTPLLSVRSGARVSMPGMMDTILNVGLTTATLPYWIDKLGKRTALDSYRRLIQMYASVAMDKELSLFEDALEELKKERGVKFDHELDEGALERLVSRYKKIAGAAFPDTLDGQLKGAIAAVFQSWMNPRAIEYRAIHGYPEDWGTAVTVQAMVFGNLNDKSGTGVCFTRDPNTGENVLWGDFLINGQGEDVVAGIRNPDMKVSAIGKWNSKVYDALVSMARKLEEYFKDMQDIEFTVQDGKLYLLQTRVGRRSAIAAFVIAHDMVQQGLIPTSEAVKRVCHEQLIAAMTDTVDPAFKEEPDLKGIAAGGGLVKGVAVFTPQDAINCTEPTILVTKETDPDDVAGMKAAVGILTQTGGITSHAAVVARGWNKACVVGCTALNIAKLKAKTNVLITLDGATGRVWINKQVPVVAASAHPAVKQVCSWAIGGEVVERVEFALKTPALGIEEKARGLAGAVYIDSCLLESPNGETYDNLLALGKGLAASKVTRVYVDLSPLAEHLSKSDRAVNWMFGVEGADTDLNVQNKAQAILKWGAELQKKTSLRGVDDVTPSTKWVLLSKGIRFVGKIRTFADLLQAEGALETDDATLANFGGEQAFKAAVDMVQKSTGKALSGGKLDPVYWYDFLNYQSKEAA